MDKGVMITILDRPDGFVALRLDAVNDHNLYEKTPANLVAMTMLESIEHILQDSETNFQQLNLDLH